MSEQNGGEGTQNPPQGDQPFKSFETEEKFKEFESKMFSSGYNNYQSKVLSRVGETLGTDVESLDDVITHISDYKQKLSEQISDPTATEEYKELQNKLKEANKQAETAKAEANKVLRQYDVDKSVNKGLLSIKEGHKLNIPEGDVRDLFNARFKTDEVDGRLIAKRFDDSINDYKPVTDDNGNYMPLDQVFAGFAKSYATPKAEGTGGESGSGSGGAKPSFEDFKTAKQSRDNEKMARLFDQAKKAGGWKENDAPPVE